MVFKVIYQSRMNGFDHISSHRERLERVAHWSIFDEYRKNLWYLKAIASYGAKICSDICPRTLSVSGNDQFLRAKPEENYELQRIENVQGQISEHILRVKW